MSAASVKTAVARCRPGASVFVVVRNDEAKLRGRTSIGTWQGLVELPEAELIRTTSDYRIYEVKGAITVAPATTPGAADDAEDLKPCA